MNQPTAPKNLRQDIELSLIPESIEVQAQEDEILADSVLELANTDFTQVYEFEDVAPGAIRKHVEADMRIAYPGKPTSRKRIFKTSFPDVQENVETTLQTICLAENVDAGILESDQDDLEELKLNINKIILESDDEGSVKGDDSDAKEVDSDTDESLSGDEIDEELDSEVDGSILGGEESQSPSSDEDKDHETEVNDGGIDIFSSRARDIEADIEKGKSIQNQLAIWEGLIECRIKLQPCLVAVNKLYQKEAFEKFKSHLNEDGKTILSNTYSALRELMKKCLILQDDILNMCPEYTEFKSKKRTLNDNEEPEEKRKKSKDLLQEIHDEYKPFRNATIEKWNEKTKISSGKMSKNDFSAFDRPTLKQIEEILLDKDRLLRRTRIKRSNYAVLGKPKNIILEDNNPESQKRRNQGEYDPEIFDDDDFYHKLLRDFIEKKTSDGTDVSKRGKQWLELQKIRSRMKAKIDMRASKGRKLRYTVHNKMVNFMAPIPSHTWTDEARNELFKSLFS